MYKVQLLHAFVGEFAVYYFQLCGIPEARDLDNVQGEMYKAYERLRKRFLKREEDMHTYLVFSQDFSKWLLEQEGFENWLKFWRYPVYHDYHSPGNLKWILKQIPKKECPSTAYVLGAGMGMEEWIPILADRVNHIEFYLEFSTKGMEELREMLLEEHGMLTELNLVSDHSFEKLKLRSKEPVLVIDYTGKLPLSVLGLKRGSIWVDMDGVEAKRHRIQDHHTGVQYLSLITIWKREMRQTLDIISKFAYNTEVKIGKL